MLNRSKPVDLDQLEEQIADVRRTPPPAIPAYNGNGGSANLGYSRTHSPLQVIAHAITRLTWTDAEKMGTEIKLKLTAEPANITAAIQEWAKDWEGFE